jgi:hypothetical protein
MLNPTRLRLFLRPRRGELCALMQVSAMGTHARLEVGDIFKIAREYSSRWEIRYTSSFTVRGTLLSSTETQTLTRRKIRGASIDTHMHK